MRALTYFVLFLSLSLIGSPLGYSAGIDVDGKIVKITLIQGDRYELIVKEGKKKQHFEIDAATSVLKMIPAEKIQVGYRIFSGEGSPLDPLSKFKVPSPPKLPEIPKRPELEKIPEPPKLPELPKGLQPPQQPGGPEDAGAAPPAEGQAPPPGMEGGQEGGPKAPDPKEEKPEKGVLDQQPILSPPNDLDIRQAENEKRIKTVTKIDRQEEKILMEMKNSDGAQEKAELPLDAKVPWALGPSDLKPEMKIKLTMTEKDQKNVERVTIL